MFRPDELTFPDKHFPPLDPEIGGFYGTLCEVFSRFRFSLVVGQVGFDEGLGKNHRDMDQFRGFQGFFQGFFLIPDIVLCTLQIKKTVKPGGLDLFLGVDVVEDDATPLHLLLEHLPVSHHTPFKYLGDQLNGGILHAGGKPRLDKQFKGLAIGWNLKYLEKLSSRSSEILRDLRSTFHFRPGRGPVGPGCIGGIGNVFLSYVKGLPNAWHHLQ